MRHGSQREVDLSLTRAIIGVYAIAARVIAMAVRQPWRGSYVPVQNGRLFIGSFI